MSYRHRSIQNSKGQLCKIVDFLSVYRYFLTAGSWTCRRLWPIWGAQIHRFSIGFVENRLKIDCAIKTYPAQDLWRNCPKINPTMVHSRTFSTNFQRFSIGFAFEYVAEVFWAYCISLSIWFTDCWWTVADTFVTTWSHNRFGDHCCRSPN